MADRLILVRHGEVEGSQVGRLLGRTDVPLSDVGRRQAAACREALGDLTGAKVVCSPLERARETAEIILSGRLGEAGGARADGGPAESGRAGLEIDPDLREFDFGAWEGMSYAEVEKADPEGARSWHEFADGFAFPGGESLVDFGERIDRAAAGLAGADADEVVCVAHGGVIRALICRFLGLPLRDYLLFEIATGSVTTLRIWGVRGVLTGLWRPDPAGGELRT